MRSWKAFAAVAEAWSVLLVEERYVLDQMRRDDRSAFEPGEKWTLPADTQLTEAILERIRSVHQPRAQR